jgi:hypothetical protein
LKQQLQRFFGDAVLRVIEIDSLGLNSETSTAIGIVLEQITQVLCVDLFIMGGKRLPGGELSQWRLSSGRRSAHRGASTFQKSDRL